MAAPTLSDKITAANAETHRRMLAGEPVLVDVQLARDAIPRLADRTILHAGPPIGWERMCGPMRGAVAGAIVFEGWARNLEDADEARGIRRDQVRAQSPLRCRGPHDRHHHAQHGAAGGGKSGIR